jgi:hypothetical protein
MNLLSFRSNGSRSWNNLEKVDDGVLMEIGDIKVLNLQGCLQQFLDARVLSFSGFQGTAKFFRR